MKVLRNMLMLIAACLVFGGVAACSIVEDNAPTNADKQTVLHEVAKRGFTDPTLAPDVRGYRYIVVYAGYNGCRLRFLTLDGIISYGSHKDVNPAQLDADPAYKPCRDAKSGAQPQV